MCGIYQRYTDEVLGGEGSEGEEEVDTSNLCFNCGSPDHSVPSCPFRRDKELISLSRQYFNFYKELRGVVDHPRIYLAEGWRQQRLEWLETFQPGQIKSPLLLEALGPGGGDWLKNIASWGYPPGWISVQDPREKIYSRIWDEHLDGGYDLPDDPFYIFGDLDEAENASRNVMSAIPAATPREDNGNQFEGEGDTNASSQANTPIRWAHYPPTYFSSELLFPYTRQADLPSSSIEWNATFDEDDYFAQMYAQPPPPPGEPPPIPPPPPSSPPPPPPLSPPPPSSSPPPPPPPLSSTTLPNSCPPTNQSLPPLAKPNMIGKEEGDEADMDISDSE